MKRIRICFVGLIASLIMGCSAITQESSDSMTKSNLDGTDQVEESQEIIVQEEPAASLMGEKVITTIDMVFETVEYPKAVTHLKAVVQKHQAYIENSNESTNMTDSYMNQAETNLRQGNFSIRIPTDSLELFLADLKGNIGIKVSEQISNQDATKEYKDTQTRIEVLKRKEERLLELLGQASVIEDILAIEDNLTATVAEREVLQSQNDSIDDLVEYSTLQLSIHEKSSISSQPGSTMPFWQRVKEAVINSAYIFYYWLQDIVIWLIYALPYLVVVVILWGVIWQIRKTKWWKDRENKEYSSGGYFKKKRLKRRKKE